MTEEKTWRDTTDSALAGMWLADFIGSGYRCRASKHMVDKWGAHHPGVVQGLLDEGAIVFTECGKFYELTEGGQHLKRAHRRNLDAIHERNRLEERIKRDRQQQARA